MVPRGDLRQRTVACASSIPSTRQTSPVIVPRKAVPSARKSWSPKNIKAFHGFLNGTSIVPTA